MGAEGTESALTREENREYAYGWKGGDLESAYRSRGLRLFMDAGREEARLSLWEEKRPSLGFTRRKSREFEGGSAHPFEGERAREIPVDQGVRAVRSGTPVGELVLLRCVGSYSAAHELING